MTWLEIITLALVQGLTEFLPISSSGHLILFPKLFGWADQGIAFDLAVHVGTLIAVVIAFRTRVAALLQDGLGSLAHRNLDAPNAKLAWGIVLATIPAGIVGLLFKDYIETNLRSVFVIASTTLIFGVLLGAADWQAKQTRDINELSWRDYLLIGIAQALALIPGTSRSGVTITAALALGITRKSAAEFSFLMSIPIIILSAGLKLKDLIGLPSVDWTALIGGIFISGLSAWLCIRWFMAWIERTSMKVFVIYRLLLAAVLFAFFL